MPILKLRRNQSSPLSCEDMDQNWEATLERQNHQGTQLASTISNLYTTVEGYDFITALQTCCEDLTTQLEELQDSIFGDGEIATLINNLRNELLQDIAEVQTDLNALTLRVTTAENTIATFNTTFTSLSNSILGLQNSKANINNPVFTGTPKVPTPVIGADYSQITNVEYVNTYVNNNLVNSIPIGTVLPYCGNSPPNSNWVLAQGQDISRVTYSALFALIGTTFGAGNGTTTFNVPNMTTRVPAGAGTTSGAEFLLGTTGGQVTHTLTESEMPNHTHLASPHIHTINDGSHNHSFGVYKKAINPNFSNGEGAELSGAATVPNDERTGLTNTGITLNPAVANNSSVGGSSPHNNMQPYIALYYIIKIL